MRPPEPDAIRLKRVRIAGAVMLLTGVASFATLFSATVTDGPTPGGPPDEALLDAGGVGYLVPLVVLVVGALLLCFRRPTAAALGLATGAAGASLVVLTQRAAALTYDEFDWDPTPTFWLAFVLRLVALAAAVFAFSSFPADAEGRTRVGWLVRVLAALVVLVATVGAYWLAVRVDVKPLAMDQLVASLVVAFVIGLCVCFVSLPPRRTQALLVALTTLCLIVVVSDLQQRAWWFERVGRAKWQPIDAGVYAILLLVAWIVHGPVTRRGATSTRRSSAPAP